MDSIDAKNKPDFISIIRRWVILSLIIIAATMFFTHMEKSTREVQARAREMRTSYTEDQHGLIKYEVNTVVKIIDYEIERTLRDAKAVVKDRVYGACTIAQNIYDQNVGSKSDREIQKLVIDALRPIRFDQGYGYFFILDLNGVTKLHPFYPDLEGTNLIDLQDVRGNYFVRKSIEIITNQGEGFCQYYNSKPYENREIEKTSFLKRMESFDWYIGSGVYLDMVEARMQDIISHYVDNNRFGANGQGYVSIYEVLDINGGKNFARVYADPSHPDDRGKLVSDDEQDAKGKKYGKEILKGLRENGECYVNYWHHKIDDPMPSQKLSFFKLAGDGRFFVAAGVHMDDLEKDIIQMNATLKVQLRHHFFTIASIFFPAILIVILLFNILSNKLKSDYDLFIDFFKRAADGSEFIDRDKVKFGELDQLAGFANRMLIKKSEIEDALRREHAQLEHWVSEQNRTEDELRKSEEKYRILVENANDAICISQNGLLKFCNPVTEKITGYPKEELSTKSLLDIVHPEDHEALMAEHEAWLSGNQPASPNQPLRFMRKDGRPSWIQASVVHVDWEDKPATLSILRDVTQQKELENKLIQNQRLEAIGTLAGGIAHDFNNILSGLVGYTQLALYEIDDKPSTKRKLEQVLKATERATSLVKQILSFSHCQKIECKPISPHLITKEVMKLIRATIPANIHIKQSLDSEGCVRADATNIHQVVMNLCTNAAHAMKETGGVLSISLQNVILTKEDLYHHPNVTPGNFIKLSVEDTGTGMSQEVQGKAFDPFFTTKNVGEGTGMGLATVHGITANLGGFVSLYSEPRQGTSIHVFLPLIEEASEPDHSTDQETIQGGTERILFVDDEPTQRELAREALSQYGYHVVTFADSTIAWSHFQQDPDAYDLVITDMTMPNMTGDVFTQKIHLKRPDIPVIMCTGYSEVIDENKAKALDIDAFLYKPVIIADLLKTIRSVLERKNRI